MPNHVYNRLQFDAKHFTTIESVIDTHGCFCEWLNPTPLELKERQPFTEGDDNTAELVEKYGLDNWYDWNVHNWGTKWGMYHAEVYNDGKTCEVRYTTAWSPLSVEILEKLHEVFGITYYEWEEEQGYGQAFDVTDKGEIVLSSEWDIPEFSDTVWVDEDGEYVCRLEEDHTTPYIDCKAGEFFYNYNLLEPFDGDISELKEQ